MRDTSLTFRQAANAQQTAEVLVTLMKIEHEDMDEPLLFCNNSVDLVSNGDTYLAYPFQPTLPDDPEEGATKGRIIVDNVRREIVAWIRGLSSSPKVTIQIVMASTPDEVEAEFPNFELTNVHYDALTVQGDLSIESFMGEPYPGDTFTPSKFPGLF
jgi:hypothetical protein